MRCGRCQQIFDANAALVNDASIVSPKEDSSAQPASGPESLEPADAAEPSDPAEPIDPTLGPDLPIASASAQLPVSDLSLGFGAIYEAVPVSSDVLIGNYRHHKSTLIVTGRFKRFCTTCFL